MTTIASVFNILDTTQCFNHDKLNYISQFIKRKSRDLQKLPKYFDGIRFSVCNVLSSAGEFPIIFIWQLKDSLIGVSLPVLFLLALVSTKVSTDYILT